MINHPIFQPIPLWNRSLKNRTVVAPMSRVSADADGVATDEMVDYYTSFAKGAFSVIITEGLYTDNFASQSYVFQPGMVTTKHIESWKKITDVVHKHHALIIAQLMHGGAISQYQKSTIAPSPIQPKGVKLASYGGSGAFSIPKPMTLQDIEQVKEGFITAAINAYKAGFDGIELHAANGYLLDQFLTPELNIRQDHYGGNIENRYRIVAEIISGIKQQVPKHFILGLRISEGKVNDLAYRWEKGIEAAKELAEQIKRFAPDYIHVAVQTGEWERDSFYNENTSLASVMRSTTHIPIIANGGLHNLDKAEKALNDNHADLLSIGKAALADPHWPIKTMNYQPIIPFHKNMLWPKATISHTRNVLARLCSETT